MLIGTIEAGGTKFVLGVLNEDRDLLIRTEIKTQHPDITLKKCVEFFKDSGIDSLGIGFFGPIDVDINSKTYGYILDTPKKDWANVDVVEYFKFHLDVCIKLDTDVNAACIAEYTYGQYAGTSDMVYITVGTGIGGSIIANNELIHGNLHSELGHISLVRHHKDLDFESVCPFHDNCAEGLCAGPSLLKRYNILGEELVRGHEAFEILSFYLAQLIGNLMMILSSKKIILGGGVMKNEFLVDMINKDLLVYLNGYLPNKVICDNLISVPTLANNAGLFGAYKLGVEAFEESYEIN